MTFRTSLGRLRFSLDQKFVLEFDFPFSYPCLLRLSLEVDVRRNFFFVSIALIVLIGLGGLLRPTVWLAYWIVLPLVLVGFKDAFQSSHAVLRNFPLIGHFRYLLEMVRPEIQQYFIERESDGRPFSREMRSVVYQRAKGVSDTIPFGTQHWIQNPGYEWMVHSLQPVEPEKVVSRIDIGDASKGSVYSACVLNISGMSYGALSKNAILALNKGAKIGGFAHNTGEGSISPYHLQPGGDLIWQVGTAYFGARTLDGKFSRERFKENARRDSVRMVELKLSQGAKPGHGGILPKSKITDEIAAIRHVEKGRDVVSPPNHSAFNGPIEMMEFLSELKTLSGGKPIGFKLCVGKPVEFFAICKAMLETGFVPDFITVDGGEGGTGAAPLEFANSLGTPLYEGLALVHGALRGIGLRDRVKILASGRIVTEFDMARALALGADGCNAARGMMFALGCIQALRCNNNKCPTGVATQDSRLVKGLHVEDKAKRVARYHARTLHAFREYLGACGIAHPKELKPEMVYRRVSHTESRTFADIYPWLEEGQLLDSKFKPWDAAWRAARATSFV